MGLPRTRTLFAYSCMYKDTSSISTLLLLTDLTFTVEIVDTCICTHTHTHTHIHNILYVCMYVYTHAGG